MEDILRILAETNTCGTDDPCLYKEIARSPEHTLINNGKRNILIECDKQFSGAGIMPFERLYLNKTGREEPTVILFRSSRGTYSDLGGSIDSTDFAGSKTLMQVAKREATEESLNLFNFDDVNLQITSAGTNPYVDGKVGSSNHLYRCYVVCAMENYGNEQWSTLYELNKKLITSAISPAHWRETDDMQRFYLSDINSALATSSTTVNDANGNPRQISRRALSCLKLMLSGNNCQSVANAAISNARPSYISNNTSDSFLKGTYSVIFL